MKTSKSHGIDFCHKTDYTDFDGGSKCSHKYEMIYVASGSGSLRIEGVDLPLEGESAYLIRPLTYYELSPDSGDSIDMYQISFSSSDVSDELAEFVKGLTKNYAFAVIKDFSACEIERIFSGLDFAEKLSPEGREQYISAMLMQILVILSASGNKQSYSSSSELAAEIADFISDNLERGRFLTLDEIAKAFFVSKFYLCRVFKGYSGTSIHAYINKKRIMMAKEYIENGMSARAASEAVGYQDYSAFYRAYVKVTGKSPKSGKGE